MVDLSQQLLARLIAGPVKRHVIKDEIGQSKGIKRIVQREARRLQPPHVAERRLTRKKYQVEYRIRPAKIGEMAGQLNDVDEFAE